ncbi:MAG: SGNH/GDSL hydrolase family protein [Oscillospiraceae bacterium]|nr:SGNH/GDSL hydrolase family protein [Oscillospiraceae bacterium]
MRIFKRIVCASLGALLLTSCLCSCAKEEEVIIPDEAGWFATWAAASMAPVGDEFPLQGLRNNTVRQQVKVSIGGNKLKLTFSNEYGIIPLVIDSVHVAKLLYAGSPNIDTSTDTVVTFNGGSESVTIPEGQTVTSDEIDFNFEALDLLAVTSCFGDYTGGEITCHSDGGCTAWVTEGNHVGDETFSVMSFKASYYYLCRMDTYAEAGTKTVVCIGDSITDGACCTFNGFDGWVEVLSQSMQSDPRTQNISVVGTGIGGNCLLHDGWGVSVKNRFERDALNVPGVRYVCVMIGINDIGGAQADISDELIAGYKELIAAAHAKGIKVYACTLTPVKGNFYYSELHEKIRKTVNEFVFSSNSGFDGVIDMSNAICREDDPEQMKDEYTCGDYLHPGSKGYEAMGKEAYYTLTEIWEAAAKAAEEENKR